MMRSFTDILVLLMCLLESPKSKSFSKSRGYLSYDYSSSFDQTWAQLFTVPNLYDA